MKVNIEKSSRGIGFFGLLTIVFITLKLMGYIDWSWWLVLMPLWLPSVLGISIFLILVVVWIFVNAWIESSKGRRW